MDKGHFKVGYTQSFVAGREAQGRQFAEQEAANQADNARARRDYEQRLEEQKQAKRNELEDEIDARLEPQKQTLRREWLANNPGQDSRDFERKAWRHLRENLKAEMLRSD